MKHNMDTTFYYCKWCGESMMHLVEVENGDKCHGNDGIIHINYLIRRREFDIIMNPILNRLLS